LLSTLFSVAREESSLESWAFDGELLLAARRPQDQPSSEGNKTREIFYYFRFFFVGQRAIELIAT
jgi:hypothetical protein